ncbi:FeMo cofactor biosynthesis protein NifB [Paraburkholderia ribeironis]|uniref:FeMo cofactor biosynthesis protein NifB n=1 Tax=Paraburkholderia ribeironis TaxID=1247936 RepID=A0A1N7S9H0_9BURK|nr:nitrogenase cofactor biosynthesis protein NifB [Paraburkholderia ribeironis]SIT43617.1 FeMo cofactor biosynthesis protein NifB [Paraburkholderia ribeironis]
MQDCANASMLPSTARIGVRQALPLVPTVDALVRGGGCGSYGGTGKSNCDSSDPPASMSAEVWEKIRNHPCYSEEAHRHYARMHVAVAPACNIQCNYCNRKYDCSNESRPGVVSEKLTPEQAVKKVMAVAALIPQLTVLGIAGPGDSLANPKKTFDTFRMLRERAPDIKLCLSTNGLALPDFVDEICKNNIDHVTITINMVDPVVGEKIYPWIFWDHRRVTGKEAARILHERQMRGLEMLTARGVLTKINSVLIPGINEEHLIEVNREVKKRGAFLHNIMPLISDPEHGTYFGLHGQRGPTARELKAVQDACIGGVNLMRHCRQCRADAVGLLGEDRHKEFTLDRIDHMEVEYDLDYRLEYQHRVEAQRNAQREAIQEALAFVQGSEVPGDLKVLIAVATKGDGRVNAHFGHVSEFQIFEVSATGVFFVGHRRVESYCQGGYGDEEGLPPLIRAINDCHAVLVAKIGLCPRKELSHAGIEPVDQYAHETIEKAALAWFTDHCSRLARGEIVHEERGDAATRQNTLPTSMADGAV